MHALHVLDAWVSYIGKSAGPCASAKESMQTAVRFPMAANFIDLNLEL